MVVVAAVLAKLRSAVTRAFHECSEWRFVECGPPCAVKFTAWVQKDAFAPWIKHRFAEEVSKHRCHCNINNNPNVEAIKLDCKLWTGHMPPYANDAKDPPLWWVEKFAPETVISQPSASSWGSTSRKEWSGTSCRSYRCGGARHLRGYKERSGRGWHGKQYPGFRSWPRKQERYWQKW